MKHLFITLSALILCSVLWGQNQGVTVKGQIIDKASESPDAYATVQFYSNEYQKSIAYTVTAEDGSFEQIIDNPGEYVLIYENIGRKSIRTPFIINSDTNTYDFGILSTEDDIEALKGAVVVSQKELVKMEVDRMTYKVEDDVDSQTSTVLEMLRKVPMVSVDGQDNISVNGSKNFLVYIDGKPNQMFSSNPSQAFKGMSASSVKTIEVITNPGVKYDAEGVGGILNITTEASGSQGKPRSDDIYFGSLSASLATRGPMGNGSFNMQKGKIGFGVSANAMHMKNKGLVTETERIQTTQDGDIRTVGISEMTLTVPSYMLNANLNYTINDYNIISISGGVSHFGMNTDGTRHTTITVPSSDPTGYDGTSSVYGWKKSVTASADYQHIGKDNPKRIFVLSYQFASMPVINNTINTFSDSGIAGYDLTDRKSDGYSNSISHILQADFTTPAGQNGSINAGAKVQMRNNLSQQDDYFHDGVDFVNDEDGSLDYDAQSRIAAAYAEYSARLGKISLNAGLRYEHTWQDMEYHTDSGTALEKNYGNLVPAASLQWAINESSNIGLSYNMRISRPGITYLNPYIDKTDPTVVKYGNSALRTEESHNTSLVYNLSLRKLSMNLTLRHHITPDGISSYSFFDEKNILHTTYGNIVRNNTFGLNVFVMYSPWSKTRLMLNGNVNRTGLKSEELNASKSGWLHSATIGVQQTLPWDIRLSMNYTSLSNGMGIQSTETGINILSLSLTRSFLDDRLALSASVVGTVDGGFNMKRTYYTEGIGFTNTVRETIPMGTATIGLAWNFGGSSRTLRKAQHKKIDDNQLNTTTIGESMSQMMMH